MDGGDGRGDDGDGGWGNGGLGAGIGGDGPKEGEGGWGYGGDRRRGKGGCGKWRGMWGGDGTAGNKSRSGTQNFQEI